MTELLDHLPSWLLSRTAARAHRLLTEGLGAEGYTGHEYRVIAAISSLGEVSQAEIGRRVALDRSDVTEAVRRLEASDVVSRRTHPDNARAVLVRLTARGRREADRLTRLMEDIQRLVVAPLTDEESTQLVELLTKIRGSSVE
jgi:DNA-binding MarR family transcriptional regulator